MSYADFEIVKQTPEAIFIVDLDRGNKSVTNDAERVCAAIWRNYDNKRIFYRDSMGEWGELVHDCGNFTGYAPYHGDHP